MLQVPQREAEKVKGKLLLDTREGLLRGGENGPVVVPGNPDKSSLIVALRYTDSELEMPPKEPLAKEQVAAFETWVRIGAPDPRIGAAGSVPATHPVSPYELEKERRFWSFQPVKAAAPPALADEALRSWPANEVDRFIAAGYSAKRLRPVPLADRRTLIRRVTFDLTGLPPTPDEVEAFEADTSLDAYEKVVNRLLASTAYGEAWGRHWLNVVRYADTTGDNSDYPAPEAWRYRDYVIRCFNEDKSYDQFLREQLAGDLLPASDDAAQRDHLIATGYLAIARRFGSRNAEMYLTIDDTIDNLGKSMLGLSIGCARCHDHKFDPIPTTDYYALAGYFASTKYSFGGTEIYRHSKDYIALGTPDEARALHDYESRLAELDETIELLTREKALVASKEKAARDLAEKEAKEHAGQRSAVQVRPPPELIAGPPAPKSMAHATLRAAAPLRPLPQIKLEMADAQEEIRKLEARPPQVERAFGATDGTPTDAKVMHKGDPKDLGEVVPRGVLTILGGEKLPKTETGSGRLQLADWIASARNPLTARVMVNRIWQFHFGKGIVATPNDFGHRGQPPVNPALLDYLADRFVGGGWSVKAMHKLILMSRTYQLASADDAADSADLANDANNDMLWRQNPRRLSAEEIRDTVLCLGQSLDRSPAGPHPFPPEVEWKYTQHKPFMADYPSNHRSVYLMQPRLHKQPFLAVFDGADTNSTTADRSISTTAIQALFMLNDPLMHDQADKLAVRVGMACGDERERIDSAYRLCFSRRPTADEVQAGQQYLQAIVPKLKEAGVPRDQQVRAALASYMRVLMSSNEFLFVD